MPTSFIPGFLTTADSRGKRSLPDLDNRLPSGSSGKRVPSLSWKIQSSTSFCRALGAYRPSCRPCRGSRLPAQLIFVDHIHSHSPMPLAEMVLYFARAVGNSLPQISNLAILNKCDAHHLKVSLPPWCSTGACSERFKYSA